MVTAEFNALRRKVRNTLDELRIQLQLVQSSLVVATRVLKQQDVEQDRDIANVLEFDTGARLDRQIECTSALIDLLAAPQPVEAEIGERVEFTRVAMQ